MIIDKGLDFPLKGSITMEDVQRAKERLLKMAVLVRDCLERNNIEYSLMFGSLLGAVRHQGFIPWDLDFDMGVMEDDYNRAMQCLERDMPDWVILQNRQSDPHYCASWTKIVDRNSLISSTTFESDNQFIYRGLHVDVYKLKKTSSANHQRDLLEENLEYFDLKYTRGLLEEDEYHRMTDERRKDLEASPRKSEPQDECFFIHLFHSKIANIFPTKRYTFEGEQFLGPKDYDRVLKDCYYKGDYMILPTYEDRDLKISEIRFFD